MWVLSERRSPDVFVPKGHFSWYELMTSDTKAAGKFYSDVVGWNTREMPSPDGNAQIPSLELWRLAWRVCSTFRGT